MSPDSGPRILRVAETQAEHLLAWFEPGYVPAHRFNLAGHVPAGPCVLWFAQPQQHAKAVRPGFHQGPVKWIDGSRVNLDQDFVVLGSGRFDLRDVNDIRRSVSGIDGGMRVPPLCRGCGHHPEREGRALKGFTSCCIGGTRFHSNTLPVGSISARFSRVFWWPFRNDGRTDRGEVCSSRELRCASPEAHTRTGSRESFTFLSDGRAGTWLLGLSRRAGCHWAGRLLSLESVIRTAPDSSAQMSCEETRACGRKRRQSPRPVSEINVSTFASVMLALSAIFASPQMGAGTFQSQSMASISPGRIPPNLLKAALRAGEVRPYPHPGVPRIPGIAALNLQCTLRIPPSPQGTRWPRRRRTPS